MVLCLMVNCHSRTVRDKEISFFRVPVIVKNQGEACEELSSERRRRWLSAISRDGLTESLIQSGRVCSRHFVQGKPAASWDKWNVDWVPTLNLGHSKKVACSNDELQMARGERAKERRKRQHERESMERAAKLAKLNENGDTIENIEFYFPSTSNDNIENSSERGGEHCDPVSEVTTKLVELQIAESSTQTSKTVVCDTTTQTEEFDYMFKTAKRPFDREDMLDDDKVAFYTGLPTLKLLDALYGHIAPHITRRSLTLTNYQELVMVLMKLRLDIPYRDLAYRFGVSISTVSRIFSSWLTTMEIRLSPLIYWPEREELWQTMPQCFQYSFGKKTTVIIDCFEVFIEKPTNLLARAQTFSSYKHHNTIKVLIGITPQGSISFVSKAWGGRTSDKFLTENCGLMNKLLPGDLVMADRGFTIHDIVALKRAELAIPAFTKGKSQLDPVDVESTHGIANVRIHVERVIGLLRNKYTILQGTLSTDYLITSEQRQVPLIDRILRVCSGLVNLCPPIIPFD